MYEIGRTIRDAPYDLFFLFAFGQSVRAQDKAENIVRLTHIRSFEPFAVAKDGMSQGSTVDILTAALAKVNMKPAFIGEDQGKEEELLLQGESDGVAFFCDQS